MKPNESNIYNYKIPSSAEEEISYFLTRGRIMSRTFWKRTMLLVAINAVAFCAYILYAIPRKEDKTKVFNGEQVIYDKTFEMTFNLFELFTCYLLPTVSFILFIIQAVKRLQDSNKSGWLLFVPFYNIYLLIINGTKGPNRYGLDPRPVKDIKYFDELDGEA